MPKLRRRHKSQIDEDSQISSTPALIGAQHPVSKKCRKAATASYQHFASAIRQADIVHRQDDCPEAGPSSLFLVKVLAGVTFVVCLGSTPDLTLRVLVLAETVIFAFPPFFSRWPVLIAILLPMRMRSLLEIVIGLALFSWISRLDWEYAWNQIGHRISRGQQQNAQGVNTDV